MTPEQQRALALARARRRRQEAESGAAPSQPAAKPPAKANEPPRIYDAMGTDAMGGATGMVDVAPSDRGYAGVAADIGQGVDNTVRMLANGMTFGGADKVAGGMDALTGQAESYDAGVKAQRARTQEFRDAHPYYATAAELAGGLVTGGGLAANGVTLAGRVGGGLLPRGIAFGTEAGLYGAASGAGNTYSDDINDYLANGGSGFLWGAGLGAGLPLAGAGVAGGFRGARAVAGPAVEGAGRYASALLRGSAQADEAGLRALGELGPEAMLVDAGPSMLGLGQGAGTGTGPGRSMLVQGLRDRDDATGPRLAATLDDALGPSPIPSRVEAGLDDGRSFVGEQYDDLQLRGNLVDAREMGESLDVAAHRLRGPAQSAVRKVRGFLDEVREPGATGRPSTEARAEALASTQAETLFETRQAIDGLLKGETDPKVIGQLTRARQGVDELLAGAAPEIKATDGQFAELSRQSTALTRGGTLFDTGKTAIRPEELAAELLEGAVPQGSMVGPSGVSARLRQGARAEVDRLVGTHANDLNTLERTLATPRDWNSQKFAAIFGEPEYETVAQAIAGNRRMRQSYQDIVQGSQTAQRRAADDALTGRSTVPMDMSVMGVGANLTRAIARALLNKGSDNAKDEIGRILATRDPERVKAIVEQLLGPAIAAREQGIAVNRFVANPASAAGAGQLGGRPSTR